MSNCNPDNKAAQTSPGPEKCGGQLGPTELFQDGYAAERNGTFVEALRLYDLALTTVPDQHPWHYRRGCVLMKMDRCEDAEFAFMRALELAPEQPAYLTNMGVCLDRLGRRDEAVRAYRRSCCSGKGTTVAFHNLGSIYAEQGREEEAIRAFEAAIAAEPDAAGWQNLGLVHYGRDDFSRALDCFEHSVECDAKFARGHYYSALCLMKNGRYEDACRRFKLGWKLDPRLSRVPFHMGSCLHKMARYQEARFSLEQALEFFPEDGRIHYQLALTCDALGLPQEARQHYSQARTARNAGSQQS